MRDKKVLERRGGEEGGEAKIIIRIYYLRK